LFLVECGRSPTELGCLTRIKSAAGTAAKNEDLTMGIDGSLAGAAVGLVGGFTSGLLGVSAGGGLVVFSVLLLGAEGRRGLAEPASEDSSRAALSV